MVAQRPDRGSVKEERWRKCKKKSKGGEEGGKRENKAGNKKKKQEKCKFRTVEKKQE